MIHLFIGSTVRSGGSLLARLLDHHPDVGSYPFELHFPMDPALHPSLAARGERNHVQDLPRLTPGMSADDVLRALLLDPDPRRCLVGSHFAGGRLHGKSRGLEIESRFDHAAFLADVRTAALAPERDLRSVYDAMHRAFFARWDGGAHRGTLQFVAYHRANGLLADVPRFLATFQGSAFIQPVRSPRACLLSEKRKVLSQWAGGMRLPDRLLKRCTGPFVEQTLVNWLVTFTRSVVLQERLGDRHVVLRYEELVRQPEPTMREVAARVGLPYHATLLRPTNAGVDWAGNSMFGGTAGIDATRAEPRDLLNRMERDLIERLAGPIERWLATAGPFPDYRDLDRKLLFDYDRQTHWFDDREKTALHLATLYERWRHRPLGRRLAQALRGDPRPWFL